MAVIRLGEAQPIAPARRVELGLPGLAALQRSISANESAALPNDLLPHDLLADDDEAAPAAALAGLDLDAVLHEAAAALRAHGVLDEDRPTDAVAANLAAITGSPRRIRTSLAGPDLQLLAYHWSDAQVGGSITRNGRRCTLSLFDSRSLGEELLGLLPDPEPPAQPALEEQRTSFTVALDALSTVAAADNPTDEVIEGLAWWVGVDVDVVAALHDWSQRIQAVLHLTVFDPRPGALPGMLVWFLDRDGWWSAETSRAEDGTRVVTISPRNRAALISTVAPMITQAWL